MKKSLHYRSDKWSDVFFSCNREGKELKQVNKLDTKRENPKAFTDFIKIVPRFCFTIM